MNTTQQSNHWRFTGYLLLAGVIIIIDQISKQTVYATLLGQPAIEILPILNITLVFNHGAAFGFLADAGGWQQIFFSVLATVVSIVLVFYLWQVQYKDTRSRRVLCYGLALILGGAIGNLIDRVTQQYVIDFIMVHYRGWQFPVFNIADSAITLGAIAFIIDTVTSGKEA